MGCQAGLGNGLSLSCLSEGLSSGEPTYSMWAWCVSSRGPCDWGGFLENSCFDSCSDSANNFDLARHLEVSMLMVEIG